MDARCLGEASSSARSPPSSLLGLIGDDHDDHHPWRWVETINVTIHSIQRVNGVGGDRSSCIQKSDPFDPHDKGPFDIHDKEGDRSVLIILDGLYKVRVRQSFPLDRCNVNSPCDVLPIHFGCQRISIGG